MTDVPSSLTQRYVGDNDPIKFSLTDDDVVRSDLASASSIEAKFITQPGGSTAFSGPVDDITPPTDDVWNAEYDFANGDTVAGGTFHIYNTVVNSGVTATYGPATLTIKPFA